MATWTDVEQTATGPNGTKMAYANGKWQDVTSTATGPDGRKMALFTEEAERPPEEAGLSGLQEVLGLPKDSLKANSVSQLIKDWFGSRAPERSSGKEIAGNVLGQTVGGAVAGAALPPVLEKAGSALRKLPFGPARAVGGTLEALGGVLGHLPPGERAIQGAGGGAFQAGADALAKSSGMAPVYSIPLSLAAGGLGEAGTSFLLKETGKLLTAAGKAAVGDANGAVNAAKGMLNPYKELNAKTAARMQQKLFGDKFEGQVDHLTSSDHRLAVQELLRKEDPTLVTGFARKPPEAQAQPIPGTRVPMSDSTELTTAFSRPGQPPLGGSRALPGPAEPKPQMSKAFAARKAAQEKAEAAQAAAALRPASDIYRERMYEGVTQAIGQGQLFSTSAPGQAFAKKLEVLVQAKQLSPGQREKLLASLRVDRNPSAVVRGRYAEALDDTIRVWGKPAEKGGQEGAAVVPAKLSQEVRADLREAFNEYTQGIGLGRVEAQYRNAYKQEMIAQAKDTLPHYLAFPDASKLEKITRNLMQDPDGKKVAQSAIGAHLANVPPEKVGKEFLRLQNVVVKAELLAPRELRDLRRSAEDIARVTDKGLQLSAYQRLQRMLLMNMSRHVMGAAGGAVAGSE